MHFARATGIWSPYGKNYRGYGRQLWCIRSTVKPRDWQIKEGIHVKQICYHNSFLWLNLLFAMQQTNKHWNTLTEQKTSVSVMAHTHSSIYYMSTCFLWVSKTFWKMLFCLGLPNSILRCCLLWATSMRDTRSFRTFCTEKCVSTDTGTDNNLT